MEPVNGGDDVLPPFKAIEAMPVTPAYSRPTWVSGRTATALSIATVAITCRGRCGSSVKALTSPTRIPLNNTVPPLCKPDTEPSNDKR